MNASYLPLLDNAATLTAPCPDALHPFSRTTVFIDIDETKKGLDMESLIVDLISSLLETCKLQVQATYDSQNLQWNCRTLRTTSCGYFLKFSIAVFRIVPSIKNQPQQSGGGPKAVERMAIEWHRIVGGAPSPLFTHLFGECKAQCAALSRLDKEDQNTKETSSESPAAPFASKRSSCETALFGGHEARNVPTFYGDQGRRDEAKRYDVIVGTSLSAEDGKFAEFIAPGHQQLKTTRQQEQEQEAGEQISPQLEPPESQQKVSTDSFANYEIIKARDNGAEDFSMPLFKIPLPTEEYCASLESLKNWARYDPTEACAALIHLSNVIVSESSEVFNVFSSEEQSTEMIRRRASDSIEMEEFFALLPTSSPSPSSFPTPKHRRMPSSEASIDISPIIYTNKIVLAPSSSSSSSYSTAAGSLGGRESRRQNASGDRRGRINSSSYSYSNRLMSGERVGATRGPYPRYQSAIEVTMATS
jgi:hypothetical protein